MKHPLCPACGRKHSNKVYDDFCSDCNKQLKEQLEI